MVIYFRHDKVRPFQRELMNDIYDALSQRSIIMTNAATGSGKTDAGWKHTVEGTVRVEGVTGNYVDIAMLTDGSETYIDTIPVDEITINTEAAILYEIYIQWDNAKTDNIFNCRQGHITVGGGHGY